MERRGTRLTKLQPLRAGIYHQLLKDEPAESCPALLPWCVLCGWWSILHIPPAAPHRRCPEALGCSSQDSGLHHHLLLSYVHCSQQWCTINSVARSCSTMITVGASSHADGCALQPCWSPPSLPGPLIPAWSPHPCLVLPSPSTSLCRWQQPPVVCTARGASMMLPE